MRAAVFGLILCATSSGAAAALPAPVHEMVIAALATEDQATISAVIRVAKTTNPNDIAEIDMLTTRHQQKLAAQTKRAVEAERERLASAGLLSLWTGEIEVGGSRSTGNTRTLGAYGAIKLKRSGLDWQHDLTIRADYQETDGQATTERAVLSWQPRYKIDRTYYVFGLTQYEHDRFLGYEHRVTAGVGVGVVAANSKRLQVELDAGPVIRYTRFYDEANRLRLAGRGAAKLQWSPWDNITLAQELAVYVQRDSTTATATTSVETLLFGPIKGRLSYNVQYERDAPPDQKKSDTVSRASLVYDF